jgi:four helix bundle protein
MNPKAQDTLNRIKYLIKEVALLVNGFPKTTASFKIAEQILSSVTSIGANFVEAQSARSRKEFISIIGVVLRETKETIFWLEIIEDLNLTSLGKIDKILKECKELAKIFSSIILTSSKRS